ncbi:hypothetical protein X975_04725, partial [Stegodyphus mimosarum]
MIPFYKSVQIKLKSSLLNWQRETNDPWICSPSSILENKGKFKHYPQCMPLCNKT